MGESQSISNSSEDINFTYDGGIPKEKGAEPVLCCEEARDLPNYFAEISTRTGCLVAVVTGWIISLFCLIFGIWIVRTHKRTLALGCSLSDDGIEAVAFIINIALTLCIDGMMFIHSVSLRWALYHEKRLEYNTNIRLFTSSRIFGPNTWYMNMLLAVFLVLSYGASSILLIPNVELAGIHFEPKPTLVNGTALIGLGIGILGHAMIATWCLVSGWHFIPTWSSNPLNTALASKQIDGLFIRQPGRYMLSVHQQDQSPDCEFYPAKKQNHAYQFRKPVRYIMTMLWLLTGCAIAWPFMLIVVYTLALGDTPLASLLNLQWNNIRGARTQFSFSHNVGMKGVTILTYGQEAVCCLLFVCAVQASQTIGLHCVELLTSISRDEKSWRRAYSEMGKIRGTKLSTAAFEAAIFSWENIFLFVAKALLHWVMGQSLPVTIVAESIYEAVDVVSGYKLGFQIDMNHLRVLIYAILAICLAVFAQFLAFKRPRGPQPANFGHLQTIIDLVDDWQTDKDGKLWWGDKTRFLGSDDQVRVAGTSSDPTNLDQIREEARYYGHSPVA